MMQRPLRVLFVGTHPVQYSSPMFRLYANDPRLEIQVAYVVRGVLSAEEIAREFESADALLFVRGAVTTQRGSAMAGIASGVPIVGYRGGSIGGPLEDAGVEWSPLHDRAGLTRGLIRVLSDPERWMELHERNLEVQKNYLSWSIIAKQFRAALDAEGALGGGL